MQPLDRFREIILCDFEFVSRPGERQIPVCMVAWELSSSRELRVWEDQFRSAPPFETGSDTLFVAYYASAELGCLRSLGWPMPERILDLYTEFRNLTNGWPTLAGNNLLGALAHFGLDGIGAEEKDDPDGAYLRGGPWSEEEQQAILDYCETDVAALRWLLAAMVPRLESLNLKVRSKEINFFRRRVCLHNSCRFVAGACEGFAGWDVGLGLGRGARRERAVAPGDRAASRGMRFSFRRRSDGIDECLRCAQ